MTVLVSETFISSRSTASVRCEDGRTDFWLASPFTSFGNEATVLLKPFIRHHPIGRRFGRVFASDRGEEGDKVVLVITHVLRRHLPDDAWVARLYVGRQCRFGLDWP